MKLHLVNRRTLLYSNIMTINIINYLLYDLYFAIFSTKMEQYLQLRLKMSRNKLLKLKNALLEVAREEEVRDEGLALGKNRLIQVLRQAQKQNLKQLQNPKRQSLSPLHQHEQAED